jgi:hypothetical protein
MAVTLEPAFDLEAMAAIVRDLVAGSPAQRQDAGWLRARVEAAGLGRHALSALESLRGKLCRGAGLLSGDGPNVWG